MSCMYVIIVWTPLAASDSCIAEISWIHGTFTLLLCAVLLWSAFSCVFDFVVWAESFAVSFFVCVSCLFFGFLFWWGCCFLLVFCVLGISVTFGALAIFCEYVFCVVGVVCSLVFHGTFWIVAWLCDCWMSLSLLFIVPGVLFECVVWGVCFL